MPTTDSPPIGSRADTNRQLGDALERAHRLARANRDLSREVARWERFADRTEAELARLRAAVARAGTDPQIPRDPCADPLVALTAQIRTLKAQLASERDRRAHLAHPVDTPDDHERDRARAARTSVATATPPPPPSAPATSRRRPGAVPEMVLDWLRDHPDSTIAEIAEGIELRRSYVAKAVDRLADHLVQTRPLGSKAKFLRLLDQEPTDRTRYGVTGRMRDALQAVIRLGPAADIMAIADAIGASRISAHDFLKSLVEHGLVSVDRGRGQGHRNTYTAAI